MRQPELRFQIVGGSRATLLVVEEWTCSLLVPHNLIFSVLLELCGCEARELEILKFVAPMPVTEVFV